MNMRSALTACLAFALFGCGDDPTEPEDGDGSDDEADSGIGDGDGDGDSGAAMYPGFIPGNCFGDECPYGQCGRVTDPSCTDSYTEAFDADFQDYCSNNPGASYCVGSEPVGPGETPGDTFCINCVDGEPLFEHCHDANVTFDVEDRRAHCVTPF